MREKIIIYGGGGHAKTVIDILRSLNTWQIIGIVDDGIEPGTVISGIPVIGNGSVLESLKKEGIHSVVNTVGGIGDYKIRWNVFERLIAAGYDFPTLIHPTAFIEPSAELENGIQILPQSYISSAAQIGFGTLINAGVVVSHDCHIGKCVNLSPGALLAGGVKVDDFAQIGMGVTININVRIGAEALIGNSAVVKSDVPPHARIYAGQIWPNPFSHRDTNPKEYRKIA